MSTEPEFVSLALDQIRPSARNPRKTFNQAALDQLAASIAKKDVIEPIIVRPRTLWQRCVGFVMGQKAIMDADGSSYGLGVGQFGEAGIQFGKKKSLYDDVIEQLIAEGRAEATVGLNRSWHPGPKALDLVVDKDPLGLGVDHYELVCGERRWRASAIAGKETIIALVRDLNDHDAAELRVIENDQREDVPPLEQAEGYADLIAMGDDVESIAAKIGRPAKYVTARLTLTNLIPTLQSDLRSGKLPFGHAHLLARLPAAEQKELHGSHDDNSGIYDYDDQPIPLDQLRREIRRDFVGPLDDAPWMRVDSEDLVPAAGSCVKCQKRSGANPTLFDELFEQEPIFDAKGKMAKVGKLVDHCTDRTCFAGKKNAFVELQLKVTAAKTGAEPLKITTNYSSRNGEVIGRDRYEEVTAKEAKADPTVKAAVITEGENAGKTTFVRVKKASTGRADDSYAAGERDRRKKAKARQEAAAKAGTMVADALVAVQSTKQLIALSKMVAEHAGSDACRIVANRRDLPTGKSKFPDHRQRVQDHAAELKTPEQCIAIIAHLTAAKVAFHWGASYFNGSISADEKAFWAAFGVDPVKLWKDAEKKDEKADAKPKPSTMQGMICDALNELGASAKPPAIQEFIKAKYDKDISKIIIGNYKFTMKKEKKAGAK